LACFCNGFMIDRESDVRRLIRATAKLVAAGLLSQAAGTAQGAPVCKPENFKIAIDVGHTSEAPGTTSARGITEYAYNLQLAEHIKKTLLDGGFGHTILITAQGVGRSQLLKRAEHANALGVDLFLSIHHDDVQDSYHSKWTYNGASQVFSDRFSGYSLFVSRQNRHFGESLAFAKLLGAALIAQGMHYSAHHAEAIAGESRQLIDSEAGVYLYDQLLVLRSTEPPAVLLEAGIIVNRREEVVVTSPEGRTRIGTAVFEAVTQFCAERQRPYEEGP
jgi:N-acetylmuramoyl-L-alanine amidase